MKCQSISNTLHMCHMKLFWADNKLQNCTHFQSYTVSNVNVFLGSLFGTLGFRISIVPLLVFISTTLKRELFTVSLLLRPDYADDLLKIYQLQMYQDVETLSTNSIYNVLVQLQVNTTTSCSSEV